MEPGLKVPLLYTAASLLSSSSSIVFVFSASPELRRRRFASPATPDAAFLTGGHPKARPPRRSSLDAAPLTEEPPTAPQHRARATLPPISPSRPPPTPPSSQEGTPTPAHLAGVAPTPCPSRRSPWLPPTPRARHAAANFAFSGHPGLTLRLLPHWRASRRPPTPRRSSPDDTAPGQEPPCLDPVTEPSNLYKIKYGCPR